MPPKNAVSQLERNRVRDRRLTRDDWLRERKPTLRQRCALYGLSIVGKKADLTERLLEYLHGEMQRDPAQREEIEADLLAAEEQRENLPQDEAISASSAASASLQSAPAIRRRPAPDQAPPNRIVQVPLDKLRAIIREEVQLQQGNQPSSNPNQPPLIPVLDPLPQNATNAPQTTLLSPTHAQLSPASCQATSQAPQYVIPENPVPVALQLPTDVTGTIAAQDFQGNNFTFESNTMSDLPPLSNNILKAIQKKEFVDFNALLPTSLYDYTADQPTLNFQINPNDFGNNTVALSSSGNKKSKNQQRRIVDASLESFH